MRGTQTCEIQLVYAVSVHDLPIQWIASPIVPELFRKMGNLPNFDQVVGILPLGPTVKCYDLIASHYSAL